MRCLSPSAFQSFLLLLLAAPPTAPVVAQAPDSGVRLLEAGRKGLEEQTEESLGRVLKLGRSAVDWFRKTQRPEEEAEARRQIGVAHLRLGRSDSALAQLKQARALASGDTLRQVDIANALGLTYEQISEWRLALGSYQEAYRLSARKGARVYAAQSLNNIGSAQYRLRLMDSAEQSFSKAYEAGIELTDTAVIATALGNLGAVLEDVGQPDSALVVYRKSLALRLRIKDQSGVVEMLNNIGLLHHNRGRLDSARMYYADALTTLKQARFQAPLFEAIIKNGLGAVERALGRPDSALKYYREALRAFRTIGDRNNAAIAVSNMGLVYAELERLDSALACFRAALDTFRVLDSDGDELRALYNVGTVYQTLNIPDSADAYFGAALKLARALGDSASQATVLSGLALVHRARGNPDSALLYARQGYRLARRMGSRDVAEELLTIGALHEDGGQLDSAEAYYRRALRAAKEVASPQWQRTTLENLGILYHRGAKRNLRRAVAYYDSAAAVISTFRTESGSDLNRLSFSEGANALFGVWALAWLDRADIGVRERALAALAAVEGGRAQALLDLIRGTSPTARPGADLVQAGAALIKGLPSPVLSYFATKDTLLIWLSEPSGEVRVARRPVTRDTLAQMVAMLSRSLRDSTSDLSGPARALAGVLLPPEITGRLPERGELIVVPHGPLALIPFSVIPINADGTNLGAGHSIRYTPSLEILRSVVQRPDRRSAVGREFSLVVGNPIMPRFVDQSGVDIDLSPLPNTLTEARSVAERLHVVARTGASASEGEVRRRVSDAVIVHLATHGYAYSSEARTRESFVALAKGAEGGVEYDGHLTVGEVLEELKPLTAELVVLSACRTGLGNLKQAEGTIGLQRAFLAKGARSVLVSLWSVPDEATGVLMQHFYSYWLSDERPTKAEALRRAQDDVRKAHPHPFFWAAFQLVGAQ